MPRVYYREEKIYGKPIETAIINIGNFETIIKNKNIPIENGLKKILKGNRFKFFQICDDGKYYDDSEHGIFYLPKALLFWETDDFTFPSEFYFIALVGNKLEIRSASGGEGVKWFNIPESQKEVTDEKIIGKIELTLESVLKYCKEYKEPPKKKIKGFKLKKELLDEFLKMLNARNDFSNEIVEMAYSPTDYFEKNKIMLAEYQIYDPSKNMYLLYTAEKLEEQNIIKTVDWNEDYNNIIEIIKEFTGITIKKNNPKNFYGKSADEILSGISKQVEEKVNKSLFCLDTDSEDCSFGFVENNILEKIIELGKKICIRIYKLK